MGTWWCGLRIEFYTKVARRGRTEYVAIPAEVRGGVSLYGKTVHVIIELVDKNNNTGNTK